MDEKNKLSDEQQPVPKQGSGYLLSSERKRQSRTVEEIADELNLSVTQIRTIELDQSEGLPEPTYVRGYIRAYARLLGIDADMVLEHYLNPNWQRGSRLDDMPRGIGSANEREKRTFFTPGKVVTVIVLLAVLGFLALSGQLNNLFGDSDVPVVSSDTPVDSASGNSLTGTTSQGNDTTSAAAGEASPQPSTEIDTAQSGTDTDENPSSSVIVNPAGTENKLNLSFSDTSWIDIRDGNGDRLAYKSYAQGEDLSVVSATPMSVFIGNAKAVSATLNGQPYDISQYREGVFARFTIGD